MIEDFVSHSSDAIVDVAIPVRVPRTFHYKVGDETQLTVGSVVQVPFRGRPTHAFVLGFPTSTSVATDKLKTVEKLLVDEPLFDESALQFFRWISDYYCHPIGEVMAAALPKLFWKLSEKQKKKARELAGDDKFLSRLGLSSTQDMRPTLTEEQDFVVSRILDPEEKRPFLLQGVTGSGKTEVYMSVLEGIIGQGKGAIILVPEIALTPQLLTRFSSRFPGQVAVLHSDLTVRERYVQWERLRSGMAKIVVGARSAIFAPIKNIGLIVVDEEHETSYKQEDSLRYNARDVAILRSKFVGAKAVLGTATPSLESYWNVQNGKYVHVTLKKRIMDRPMPKTTFVDLKARENWHSPHLPWISHTLVTKMGEVLKAGQQVLLYLNRLGFAHFLYCRECGHSWRCKNCDVALTYYQHPPLLKCHYCSLRMAPPTVCEQCGGVELDTMGLGTEQVVNELAAIFPGARIVRMDRSIVKTRKQLEEVLNSIANYECDIVVGTQMVVKGHDFPGIALVGILVADASLNIPDFRAYERTYQIITQVSGRAGRAEVPGEVVIQTVNPDHPVLLMASENRPVDFYDSELEARRRFGFPPYCRMAMLRFQHRKQDQVEGFARDISQRIRDYGEKVGYKCTVIGPAEAPVSRIKNLYRWHCLVKAESVGDLQTALGLAREYATHRKTPVQMSIDVDPMGSL